MRTAIMVGGQTRPTFWSKREARAQRARCGARGFLLALALAVSGCQSLALAPVGTRAETFVPEDDERRLWNRAREAQERLNGSGLLDKDLQLTDYLNAVARRLIPDRVTEAGVSVEVRIIKNPTLNAFAFPNGVIYVHTGLLARMDNEAQLATLLAHELTHVTHRHTVRQFRDIQNKSAFFASFQVVAAPFGVYGSVASLLGMVGTLAAVYGYSQEIETEADREGLAMMVKAGYDPREAPKLFLHLKQWVEEEKKPEPFFFNTHPRLIERVESYQEIIKDEYHTLAEGRDLRTGEEEFRVRIDRLLLDNVLLDLQAGRFLQAQKGLGKFLTLNPQDARAHHYMAETYRRQNDPKTRPEAIRLYQAAIALDTAYPDPYRGLGTLHYQEGNTAEAVRAFERYLELAPVAADRAHIQSLLDEVRK